MQRPKRSGVAWLERRLICASFKFKLTKLNAYGPFDLVSRTPRASSSSCSSSAIRCLHATAIPPVPSGGLGVDGASNDMVTRGW